MKKLTLLLILCLSFARGALAGDFIPYSVGVMVSPSGYNGISRNLENLLYLNGISPNSFYLEKVEAKTEEGPLESLVENQPELYDLVKTWREYLQRVLIGIRLDKHQFALEAQNLEANVEWDEFNVNFLPASRVLGEKAPGVILNLTAQATSLLLGVDKVRGKDLINPYLGEAGFNDIKINMDPATGPLEITAQLHITKDQGGFNAKVLPLQWNWQDLTLEATYDRPLVFPEVKILINGHAIDVNVAELDNIFREKLPALLAKASEVIEKYVTGDGVQSISRSINEKVGQGLNETNIMEPPGAPNKKVKPFIWGLHLDTLGMKGDNISINLSGFARDGVKAENLRLKDIKSARKPFTPNVKRLDKHDAAISLNQGLINQIIKLSAKRGYFNSIKTGSGAPIKLTKRPMFDLTGKKPKVSVEVEYKVEGFRAAFVKNPIRINLDLLLDFPVKNGKASIVAKGVDMSSVFLHDKYIRLFAGKVRDGVKSEIKKLQPGLVGYALAESLPLPDTLLGIGLKIKHIDIDKNGHLVVYHDFDWSELEENE
jgi:hypothetical protein